MNTLTYGNSFVKQGYARDNVILLEELEFSMPKNQLDLITQLHNEGNSYKEISKLVKRNEYEVIIALLHQVKRRFKLRPLANLI